MKLHIQQVAHDVSPAFKDLLCERLGSLAQSLKIDEARIRIERHESSPPFRMAAHLVTPGPDVMAEAVDHTLRAALQKLIDALRERITHRNQKRDRRSGGGVLLAAATGRRG